MADSTTLETTDHEVIRAWAERRGAKPAMVRDTKSGEGGVLRLDFPGYSGEKLEQVSWDEWFKVFDDRKLRFVYQEHTKDGSDSNFFRLVRADD
jgi:hypothetical protein